MPLFCMKLMPDDSFEWKAPFDPNIALPWLDAEHDVGPAVLQIFKDGLRKWSGHRYGSILLYTLHPHLTRILCQHRPSIRTSNPYARLRPLFARPPPPGPLRPLPQDRNRSTHPRWLCRTTPRHRIHLWKIQSAIFRPRHGKTRR